MPRLRPRARVAGLKEFDTPTLAQVERRRMELLTLVFILLVAMASVVALLASVISDGTELDVLSDLPASFQIGMVLLVLAFAAYVFEKEKHLRKVSHELMNERVLSAALSNRLKEISSLTEAGKAVVSALELEDVLNVVLNAAFDLLGADEGSILLVEGEDLVVATASGHAESFIGTRHGLDEGIAGYVARNREPLLVQGQPDLRDISEELSARESRVRSSISVPMEAKGELFGVLSLNMVGSDQAFNEYDLRALVLFGEHAAMAIRHARALRKERDLRSRMVELDRMRTELVGTITHDLKGPLTTIMGSAKILRARAHELDETRRDELMDGIERQSQRLLELIDRLLDAARAQARYALAPGPVDLAPQIERLISTFSSAHGRRIDLDLPEGRLDAWADAEAVEQILANLLDNATKYTPPGATIAVSACTERDRVVLRVSDEGPGLPAGMSDEIFDPFRQGDRSAGGVGLGLFIVANLVRAMNGDLEVHSAPGRGTTFELRLPVRATDPVGDGV